MTNLYVRFRPISDLEGVDSYAICFNEGGSALVGEKLRTLRQLIAVLLVTSAVFTLRPVIAQSDFTPQPDEIVVVKDTVYGRKDGMALTFDVFKPAIQNGAAVISINSGAWVSPAIEMTEVDRTGRFRLRTENRMVPPEFAENFSPWPLLENGFTVIYLRHSSQPKYSLSEIVDDIFLAISMVYDRAEEFGVDRERIGLVGASSGGYLALMGGSALDAVSITEQKQIAAVVAFFPHSNFEEYFAPASHYTGPASLDPAGVNSENSAELSPVNFASIEDPPTLIIHGDQDANAPLSQGRFMRDALMDAGATAELIVVAGAGHGFSGSDATLARDATVEWFQRYLN